jgi:hypothetical protein
MIEDGCYLSRVGAIIWKEEHLLNHVIGVLVQFLLST